MKLDHFPLYPEKILSSLDLQVMEPCAFGMYCRILFASYIQDKPCYIKNEDKKLMRVAGATTEQWATFKQDILKEFKEENGYFFNEQLLSIYKVELRKNKKNSKEQLSFVASTLNYSFEDFWKDYDKRVGDKKRLIPKWMKLTDAERLAVKTYIPKYKLAQPEKMYRKNPETFLNQRGWEHEIIKKGKTRIDSDNHGTGAAI